MAIALRCLWIVSSMLLAASGKLATLRRGVMELMEKEGPNAIGLAPLLDEIVALTPDDHDALGLLALHRTHHGDLKRALELMTRLRRIDGLQPHTKIFAAHLSQSLRYISAGDMRRGIAPLRQILNIFHLMSDSKKLPLHYSFEAEASMLLGSVDSRLQDVEANSGIPTNRAVASYVPGLLGKPFWPSHLFHLASALAGSIADISREIHALRRDRSRWHSVGKSTDLHDSALVTRGQWLDLTIFKHLRFVGSNCKALPRTCALIQEQLDVTTNPYAMVLVDELSPGTEVQTHHGVFNGHLTFHLPLSLPEHEDLGIRVAGKHSKWSDGKVLVFDDSYDHSVWHRGNASSTPRLVLLLRAWHPELSLEERRVTLDVVSNDPNSGIRTDDKAAAMRQLKADSTKNMWRKQSDSVAEWAKHDARYAEF